MAQSTDERTKFLIVAFEGENIVKNKQSVELVISTWLVKYVNKTLCYFPPKKEYKNISKWIREEVKPQSNWKLYAVNVLSETCK